MKTPLFIDNNGDILVFESVQDAENWIEPIDVRNGEYEAFDAEGCLLRLTLEKEPGFWKFARETVKISSAENEPSHADELRKRLLRFLKVANDRPIDDNASLSQLVNTARRFAIK